MRKGCRSQPTQGGVGSGSPKALLLLIPVVKEEKSLVLP